MKRSFAMLLALTLVLGLGGCGQKKKKDIDIDETWETMEAEMGDQLMGVESVEEENLEALYGIKPEQLEEFELHMAMINVKADEYLLAKVASGEMEKVRSAIEERAKALDEQWATYLPEQHELVKNYVLVDEGDYIFFAIGERAEDMKKIFQESFQ